MDRRQPAVLVAGVERRPVAGQRQIGVGGGPDLGQVGRRQQRAMWPPPPVYTWPVIGRASGQTSATATAAAVVASGRSALPKNSDRSRSVIRVEACGARTLTLTSYFPIASAVA